MLPFRLFILEKLKDFFLKMLQVKKFFFFSCNEKHWNNKVETFSLIDKIVALYIGNVKEFQFPKKKIRNFVG